MSDASEKDMRQLISEVVDEAVRRLAPQLETHGVIARSPGYNCTGQFGCDTFYICDNNNHSCRDDSSFTCGGTFSCTGGAFGIVIEESARDRA